MRSGYDLVRQRIDEATLASGRRPGDVRLVAVTKTISVDVMKEVISAGVTDIGENKVQEASSKFEAIGHQVRWHLIGHLQENKVKKAVELFDVIQTVDSGHLAERLESACHSLGRESIEVLLQVNVDDDTAKYGVAPHEALDLARRVARLERLRLRGLMTIGRLVDSPEAARSTFKSLRELARAIDEAHLPGVVMSELSMGMSSDFDVAISEGSTIVRVGSAIFGQRSATKV